ncbi:MAG: cupin domain-containing protein [Kofleriaceae bacterium]
MWAPAASAVTIVRRADLPTLRSVVVDGHEHALGLHKDFRKNSALAAFMPEHARLSVAWVYLEHGETLDPHRHPISSMIIVCHGSGKLLGDLQSDLAEGDIVAIPGGQLHGFIGGARGFWALSVQFEEHGLYERPDEALVRFEGDRGGLDELVRQNVECMNAYQTSELFVLVRSPEMANATVRNRLLDALTIWSRQFQRVVMSRLVFHTDPRFGALAREHLAEEYGHDANLEQSRESSTQPLWDPTLEALAAWFPSRMLSMDELEKLVLVHNVLEGGANVFYKTANPVMQAYREREHFSAHCADDDKHLWMGLDLLRGHEAATYARLAKVQREGWDMLTALCDRIAQLSRLER